ncbi:Large-conductance mechanosensitive channel [hydrothermal vent metagenome]|uniref:Large-conductance mechanosensitive channel n=1 Tax=hydrothermal vent metagenome TaxID=652676 RepID=A0A3B0VM71_9ZZZZ
MVQEFKAFVTKGNVLDLAVAVIIGGAFGAIITSLVNDIIMPLIGAILGGVDFTTLAIEVGDASITYGNFIQAIINFLIIAFVIFMIVRQANKLKAEEPPAPPAGPSAEDLLGEIRDLLKAKS